MIRVRDAYDDLYDQDRPPEEPGEGRRRVRPLALAAGPALGFQLVAPDGFEAAETIGERLRAGTPVLVDLHRVDPETADRLTDFCSGLVYAVDGGLQQVGRDVLLLTPDRLDVTGDELSAVREPGFFNRC